MLLSVMWWLMLPFGTDFRNSLNCFQDLIVIYQGEMKREEVAWGLFLLSAKDRRGVSPLSPCIIPLLFHKPFPRLSFAFCYSELQLLSVEYWWVYNASLGTCCSFPVPVFAVLQCVVLFFPALKNDEWACCADSWVRKILRRSGYKKVWL